MVQRFLITLFCFFSLAAHADYPDRPIRIIVPFPAGDGLDIQARMIGQKLTERLGQQVIIDNKPGAGTLIGVEAAAKSPGDAAPKRGAAAGMTSPARQPECQRPPLPRGKHGGATQGAPAGSGRGDPARQPAPAPLHR